MTPALEYIYIYIGIVRDIGGELNQNVVIARLPIDKKGSVCENDKANDCE